MAYDYDLVVVGCGPAGEKGAAAGRPISESGSRSSRRAPKPGGAGVHTGTLPSKTLRETALVLSRATTSASSTASRSSSIARTRCRSSCRGARRYVELEVARILWNLERHKVDFVRGAGKLRRCAHAASSIGRRASARSPARSSSSPPARDPFSPRRSISPTATSTTATRSSISIGCQRSLTILGAGVIGCEYACMFAAMGVKVHIVESRGRLLPFLDLEIADRLRQAMVDLGIDLRLGVSYTSVAREEQRGIVTQARIGRRYRFGKAALRSGAQRRDGGARAREDRRRGRTSAARSVSTATTGPRCRTSTRPATSSAFLRSRRRRWSRRASRSATRSAGATRSR